MSQRIALIGSAGVGKSSFADAIAKELNLHFVRSKDITRPILKKYGFTRHSGIKVEEFLGKAEIESEILFNRVRLENEFYEKGFITDRSALECFAYALLNASYNNATDLAILEQECRNSMARYSSVFHLPANAGWLTDNGIRTIDENFQRIVDYTICGIANSWGIKYFTIPEEIIKFGNVVDFVSNTIN